jgi:hypothetical protein
MKAGLQRITDALHSFELRKFKNPTTERLA